MEVRSSQLTTELLHKVIKICNFAGLRGLQFDHSAIIHDELDKYNWTCIQNPEHAVLCPNLNQTQRYWKYLWNWAYNDKPIKCLDSSFAKRVQRILKGLEEAKNTCYQFDIWFHWCMAYRTPLILDVFGRKMQYNTGLCRSMRNYWNILYQSRISNELNDLQTSLQYNELCR